MAKKISNKEIFDAFFNVYFRAPKMEEFKACGGHPFANEDKYKHSYFRMTEDMGYGKPSRAETFEVIRMRTGEVIFTGSLFEIADEIDGDYQAIRKAHLRDGIYRNEYRIRHKPFDVELVMKELRK